MQARSSSNSQVVRGQGRGGSTGQQPAARWRRDSGSALQLLASPLVSRSSSPNPEWEDEERITDIELEEKAGVRPAGQEAEVTNIDLSSFEEEEEEDKEYTGTETVSPEVSSDEEDEPCRAAKARMAFRRIRRAAAGFGRIWLGDAAPSGHPEEAKRIFATRAEVVRRVFAQRAVARAAAAAREWQKRLDEAEAEEAAIWARPGPPEQPPLQAPPPPSPPPSLSQPPPLSPPRAASPPPPPPGDTTAAVGANAFAVASKTARWGAGLLGEGALGVADIRSASDVVPGAAVPTSQAVSVPPTFGGQQPLAGDGRGRVAAQGGSRGQQAAEESP
ncbi:histone-lysine N-methyltransferase SETD1B-like [Drosophila rhopaloa]|uniref:Uncharacterized protein n=1 Tax=Drosophila rhopaloa TaxID=1041015 RepID=A0ABM5J7D7_DRORH|nr:histone-lysine N-methyltransferase SETD1B-like [Drosophila rhopaloa]